MIIFSGLECCRFSIKTTSSAIQSPSLFENHSSISLSRTATASSANVILFEWVEKDQRPHPFEKGTRVSIEYTLVPCGGKKPKENDDGFAPGCALKLCSIMVLEMTNESVRLDTNSPSKRRKL